MTRHNKAVNIKKKTKFFWKKIPAWILVTILVIAAAGAATGFVFKDTVKGTTSITVSQAIIIDYTRFSPADIIGADVGLPSVNDDGSEWMVHIETNNGDLIIIDLPIANLADQNIMVELLMWGEGPYTMDIDSLHWWTDANHDELTSRDEAILLTTDAILDRMDEVRADGFADLTAFSPDHWFFDGSIPNGVNTYNDDVFTDEDGTSPEAILLDDGNGILDPGSFGSSPDVLITPGQASLAEFIGPYILGSEAVGKMFFSDNTGSINNRWNSGEDIFLNNDGDGSYTTAGDELIDANGYNDSAIGTADNISPGDLLEVLDALDDLYWDDVDNSKDFTLGDHLWLDLGDNVYFNSNGESISDTNPSTTLVGPSVIFDASLDLAFDGAAPSTYFLENSGYLTAGDLSTLGLEDYASSALTAGDIVEVDAQGNWYIINSKSTDLDQRSTIQLIGDVDTSGDALKGLILNEQTPTLDPTQDLYFGVPAVFESATTDDIAMTYDPDSDRVVMVYSDDGNSGYGTAVVGQVSDTTISFGTPVVFESAPVSEISATFDTIEDRVVIAYRDEGNSDYGTAIVGAVSGNTILFGSPTVFESDTTSLTTISYDSGQDRVVIAYRDEGNSDYGTAIVGSVTGATVSFGTPVVFESATVSNLAIVYDPTNLRSVITYRDEGNFDYGTAIVGTVSGSTIGFGLPVIYSSNAVSQNALTYDSAASRVVLAYRDEGNLNYGTTRIGEVSGTTIGFGSPVVFESGATTAITATFNEAVNKVVLGYRDQSNANYGTAIVGTVSGSSISFGTAKAFESASTDIIASVFDSSNSRIVHAYRDIGNAGYGTAIVSTVSGSGVFVAGAQTMGADGTLDLTVDDGRGALVDASQLDSGEVWALDDDGVLGSETVYLILDSNTGSAVNSMEILGQAAENLPDNYQFYRITLADSGTQADIDDHYLNSGNDIATAIDDAISGLGDAVYDPLGFSNRYKIDSDDSNPDSAVIVTPGSIGTDVTDELKLGLVNGGLETTRDRILRGSPTNDVTAGNELVTSVDERFSFVDEDGDDRYDNGEDLYEEQTGGAGTYSSISDTLIYTGGTIDVVEGEPGRAGSSALSVDDDDNIMFIDYDHDLAYDWSVGVYEPLLHTGYADIEPMGMLTSSVSVLARHGGDWPSLIELDMRSLLTHFNGANDHNYHFIDDDGDGLYDDGEAIIDQIDGRSIALLESADHVVHNGLANLFELPVALSQLSAENCGPTLGCGPYPDVKVNLMGWKFLVPGINDLGSPLDIRIIIAIEDAASPCMFEIFGKLRPVNV